MGSRAMLTMPHGCAIVWCPGFGKGRSPMPDSKTYTGGCHCGLVRFECTTDLAMVTACNCSICTKKGLHFTLPAAEELSAPRRRGQPEGISVQQARDPPSALHRLRRRRVRARQQARRHRGGGAECQLHRRHRAGEAHDDADRRTEQVALQTSVVMDRGLDQTSRPGMTERIECATDPAPCSAGKFPPR